MVRLVNQVVSRESRYLTLRRALAWLKYLNERERERTIALIYLENVELFLLLRTILRIDVL